MDSSDLTLSDLVDQPSQPNYIENHEYDSSTQALVPPTTDDWKCGSPYQYLVPRPDGDPWAVLLDYVTKQDEKRCAGLKDEVQLSLLVASLFSAVVVAFLIDIKSKLYADPSDEIISLLVRLVTIIENPKNTTLSSTPILDWQQIQDAFIPELKNYGSAYSYFVSVWFSMGAVVLAVSALQWLQTHQTYPAATPRQRFAMFHMRKLSFQKWGIPVLIRLLPVLLLAALYTFLVGLSGFHVAILPVDLLQVLFGWMLTFAIFLLTVLPVLQEYMLHFPRINPFLRGRIQAAPIPYRSIQANIMRLIVISSKVTMYIFIFWAYSLLIPLYIVVTTYKGVWSSKSKLRFTAPNFYSPHRHGSWSELDWEWLMIRWTHFTELYDTYLAIDLEPRDVSGLHFDDRLLYDAIEGLIQDSEHHVTEAPILYAAYHCFEELSSRSLGMRSWERQSAKVATPAIIRNNRYIQALLANPGNRLPFHASSLSSAVVDPTINLLHEENLLLFIQAIFSRAAARLTSEQSPNPIWPPAFSSPHLTIMAQHLGELHVRVKGHMFLERLLNPSAILAKENSNLLPRHVDWSIVYLFQYVEEFDAKKVFAEKYLGILSTFFKSASSDLRLEWRMGALLTHSNLHYFILNGARTTHYAANTLHGMQGASLDQLLCVFGAIREGLIQYLSQPRDSDSPPADLLFYSACIYVQYLTEREAGDSPLADALDDIIPILRTYKAQTPANEVLEGNLGVAFSERWWSFLSPPEMVRSTEKEDASKTPAGKRKSHGIRLLPIFHRRESSPTEALTEAKKLNAVDESLPSGKMNVSVEEEQGHIYPPNNRREVDSDGTQPLLAKDPKAYDLV